MRIEHDMLNGTVTMNKKGGQERTDMLLHLFPKAKTSYTITVLVSIKNTLSHSTEILIHA
jgi:hypothetical protein